MTEEKKEFGAIVSKGMGGFLKPPTHPEHNYSVQYDLDLPRCDRSRTSLTNALEQDWLADRTKEQVRKLLSEWQKPAIDSPEVVKWIRQVLGYFGNREGVKTVLEFYPDWVPTVDDFLNAKWGD